MGDGRLTLISLGLDNVEICATPKILHGPLHQSFQTRGWSRKEDGDYRLLIDTLKRVYPPLKWDEHKPLLVDARVLSDRNAGTCLGTSVRVQDQVLQHPAL
eukprot:4341824-Amphidinium_carterae.1